MEFSASLRASCIAGKCVNSLTIIYRWIDISQLMIAEFSQTGFLRKCACRKYTV